MLDKGYTIASVIIIVLICIIAIVKSYQGGPYIRDDKEYIVNEFNDNIQYFEIVKKYFLEQGTEYYIVRDEYKEVIKDVEVVDAITYILEKLEYDTIKCIQSERHSSPYIIFIKGVKYHIETGIVYTKNEGKYRYVMDEIKDDWHFHGHAYSPMY